MLKLSKQGIRKDIQYDAMYSLRSLKTPDAARLLAIWIMIIITVFLIVLFLPWQQNIRGNGKVTAFNPSNRPQTIETIIAGRISKWHVREGMSVVKGDTIITLTEVKEKYFDPMFLQRMREQIDAKSNSLNSKESKAKALERQIVALKNGMQNKIDQSKAKLQAERVRFKNSENQYQRNKKLFEAGNIPLTKFQDIEYKYQGSKADLSQAEIELSRVEAEYLDKISG